MPAFETRISTLPNVETALDAGVDLIFLGHVHGNRNGVFLAAKLPRGGLRRVEVEIRNDDTAAGCNVTLGDAVTDAARCAGDEGDFAIEFHDARSFFVSM